MPKSVQVRVRDSGDNKLVKEIDLKHRGMAATELACIIFDLIDEGKTVIVQGERMRRSMEKESE